MTTTETTDETTVDTEVQETAPEAQETPQGAQEAPEVTEDAEGGKAHREAAKYRRQLRETEAERDALTARLDALERDTVERMAAGPGLLARADELWHHVAMDDLRGEDGSVTPERVQEAVTRLLTERPHLAARRFQGGADGGMKSQSVAAELTWQDALQG